MTFLSGFFFSLCISFFSNSGLCGFSLQDEGPTARDLMIRYSTGKKSSKNKKKMEKAMKVLKVYSSIVSSFIMLICGFQFGADFFHFVFPET